MRLSIVRTKKCSQYVESLNRGTVDMLRTLKLSPHAMCQKMKMQVGWPTQSYLRQLCNLGLSMLYLLAPMVIFPHLGVV